MLLPLLERGASSIANTTLVLTQYFGSLRRNPNDAPDADYTGYDFWLTKLNQWVLAEVTLVSRPKAVAVKLSSGGEVVAIDPFKIDLTPLGEVLADASVLKVFHAAGNDLPLLADAAGHSRPSRAIPLRLITGMPIAQLPKSKVWW